MTVWTGWTTIAAALIALLRQWLSARSEAQARTMSRQQDQDRGNAKNHKLLLRVLKARQAWIMGKRMREKGADDDDGSGHLHDAAGSAGVRNPG